MTCIAAIASAIAALSLSSLEETQRGFLKKQNAAQAIQQWQINTAQTAPSGFKCQQFLGTLVNDDSVFVSAWDKKEYDLEGKSKQQALKACLDRENRVSLPALENAMKKDPYVPGSIRVTIDVSRFITTQALNYLNITEAVYMQWKYEIAERCIIEEQLGVPTSESLRSVVNARPDSFRALSAFFEKYKNTDAVRTSIQECRNSKKI